MTPDPFLELKDSHAYNIDPEDLENESWSFSKLQFIHCDWQKLAPGKTEHNLRIEVWEEGPGAYCDAMHSVEVGPEEARRIINALREMYPEAIA